MPKKKSLSKKQKDLMEVVGEIIVLLLMIKPIFGLSILTGIFYLIAIIGSVYHGTLFRKKDFARYLLGGTILCYAAGTIAPSIFQQFKSGDWLSFWIMFVIALFIWIKGFFMKKGIDL